MTRDNDIIGNPDVRDNKLYKLLFEHLPNFHSKNRDNTLDVRGLSEALETSDKAVYAWFNRGFLPPSRMKDLIALKGSTLNFEILAAYTK